MTRCTWIHVDLDPFDEGDGEPDTRCDYDPLGMRHAELVNTDDEPTLEIVAIVADPPGTVYSAIENTIVFAAPPAPRRVPR